MASSSQPALEGMPQRLLLTWESRESPVSKEIIVRNPGKVIKTLIPDIENVMTDANQSILESEQISMGDLFSYLQTILKEQEQRALGKLDYMLSYFEQREEAEKFALSLAHADLDKRIGSLEDALRRQVREGTTSEADGVTEPMDFEYTKLQIIAPPAPLHMPIMEAVSDQHFAGKSLPTDLQLMREYRPKSRMRREGITRRRTSVFRRKTSLPILSPSPQRTRVPSFLPPGPSEALPPMTPRFPPVQFAGTPFHRVTAVPEETEFYRSREHSADSWGNHGDKGKGREEAIGGGNGGNKEPPKTRGGGPPDSDPDSSDDDIDWSDKKARKKALRRMKREIFQDIRDMFGGTPQGAFSSVSTRLPPKKSIAPETFEGHPDDLDRFVRSLEGVFELDKAHYVTDLDKISYTAALLRGKASKWYETIHVLINEEAAKRLKTPFDPESPWRKWPQFINSLISSFGGSITREKAVAEWRALKHDPGKIDEFLDRALDLIIRTGYSDEAAIKDHLSNALHRDIFVEWSKVMDPPTELPLWMSALRALGHKLENLHRTERTRQTAPTNQPQRSSNAAGTSRGDRGKGKEKDRNSAGGRPDAHPRESTKAKPRFDLIKDKTTALAGISSELRTKRFEKNLCTRCGIAGHKWIYCNAPSAVGDSTSDKKIAGVKRKRGRESQEQRKRVAQASAQSPVEIPGLPAQESLAFDPESMNIVDPGAESGSDIEIY